MNTHSLFLSQTIYCFLEIYASPIFKHIKIPTKNKHLCSSSGFIYFYSFFLFHRCGLLGAFHLQHAQFKQVLRGIHTVYVGYRLFIGSRIKLLLLIIIQQHTELTGKFRIHTNQAMSFQRVVAAIHKESIHRIAAVSFHQFRQILGRF